MFSPLKQGGFATVKFLVVYYLREGKVAHRKAATWPPDVGVSKPSPRLGGSPQRA